MDIEEDYPSDTREQDCRLFLESDRIWPPSVRSVNRTRFERALLAVLRKLPDDVFSIVDDGVSFVVDEGACRAINVPFSKTLPLKNYTGTIAWRIDQIVIFNTAFQLSDEALVALVAHEIAHSVEKLSDHQENENAADALVVEWGFARELEALRCVD